MTRYKGYLQHRLANVRTFGLLRWQGSHYYCVQCASYGSSDKRATIRLERRFQTYDVRLDYEVTERGLEHCTYYRGCVNCVSLESWMPDRER